MATESSKWGNLRQGLAAYGHFERVENGVGDGTPDVDFCIAGVHGKIENKYVEQYPKRKSTPVIPAGKGLRVSQTAWFKYRLIHGGRCFVMVFVAHDIWLFRPDKRSVSLINTWDRQDFAVRSCWHHDGGLHGAAVDYHGLIALLIAPV